jgi:hypothetical protein
MSWGFNPPDVDEMSGWDLRWWYEEDVKVQEMLEKEKKRIKSQGKKGRR